MEAKKIDVTCYSGYRLNEKPTKFNYKGNEYHIEKILNRSVEESINGEDRRLIFLIRCQDNKIFSIYYDTRQDQWYLKRVEHK